MQGIQTTFQRVERKYLLDEEQYQALRFRLEGEMEPDRYAQNTICNLYYDTPNYQLIRTSLDKPVYKEKLRLRSYGVPADGDTVFVELKKKYKGVVYKRRVPMELRKARAWLAGESCPEDSQICREIQWTLQFYHPRPAVFLAYQRQALAGREDPQLRVTFDQKLRFREEGLDLVQGDWGSPLLPEGQYLMEVKIPGALPLWMSHLFDQLDIYPTSFSKYGTYYSRRVAADRERKEKSNCA